MMVEIVLIVVAAATLALVVECARRLRALAAGSASLPDLVTRRLEEKHQAMLRDLGSALAAQTERVHGALAQLSDGLRELTLREHAEGRERLQKLAEEQARSLLLARTALVDKVHQVLAEHGRAGQELIQTTLRASSQQLTEAVTRLTQTTDARLDQISGKVSERLDEGFKKTNETFVQVMSRLATIDEAQKKIDGLATNVVGLRDLLGDKRARGAFGEVQLEVLVRNVLPPQAYAMQHSLTTGARVDCALFLPPPTGTVAVDSKFPLENFQRMCAPGVSEVERAAAAREFKLDVRRHIDAIADKYIVPEETSDGALMFLPAEAVFAEIHAHHPDLVAHAQARRVWIVSPTTMMAVLTMAHGVLKNVETRKQVHIIKESLTRLGREFERFDERMTKLQRHIEQANRDAEDVCVTSRKISRRFAEIEQVQLEPAAARGEEAGRLRAVADED
jgi:DNA recombination protein RmuC